VCRRKHDPRFNEVLHEFSWGTAYRCWYEKGMDIDQFLAKRAAELRKQEHAEEETREFADALKRFKGNHGGFMAWIEARARIDVNRERKLDALHRLVADPRTPAGEAQAARAAIERLRFGQSVLKRKPCHES